MTDAAAIQATFSDYRTVKGRKVLQIIFEVPIERQGEVFAALGYPMPDAERWCAIALLRDPAPLPGSRRLAQDEDDASTVRSRHPPGGAHHVKDPVRSQAGKARYAESDDMQRAEIRAAMLMHDEVFQYWVATHSPAKVISEAAADHFIKTRCGIESKRDLASNEAAYEEFRKMETEFAFYAKRLPEVR